MAVPRPRPIQQNETVARVAEPCLQKTTHRRSDSVVGDWRVAIMRDACDSTGLFRVSAGEAGIKTFECVCRIDDAATTRWRVRRLVDCALVWC